MTMFSGTFTALVYDSLKTEGREDEYIQVSANSSQISMLANAIGSLASLLKRFLGFAGFYLLSAAFEGVSTAALALMEEPSSPRHRPAGESRPSARCPASSPNWRATA